MVKIWFHFNTHFILADLVINPVCSQGDHRKLKLLLFNILRLFIINYHKLKTVFIFKLSEYLDSRIRIGDISTEKLWQILLISLICFQPIINNTLIHIQGHNKVRSIRRKLPYILNIQEDGVIVSRSHWDHQSNALFRRGTLVALASQVVNVPFTSNSWYV